MIAKEIQHMNNHTLEELQTKIYRLKKEQAQLESEAAEIIKEKGGDGIFSIRPAGRHVLTIGEDLIQDQCAAIIELVKNAYDADASVASIVFSRVNDGNIRIVIKDNGHGMTLDDIVYKWLVPSTDNKVENRTTPSGRIMQGRKGIGRYAASILGNSFKMETISKQGVRNTVEFEWSQFNEAAYLDSVGIKVHTESTTAMPGTILTMDGDTIQSEYWNDKTIKKLKFELKRLISPKEDKSDSDFDIVLSFENFYDDPDFNISEIIEAFPIIELFDYRISGRIDNNGQGTLLYECQKVSPSVKESIPFSYGKETKCGDLVFDIRVYDRESESIDTLIKRGLKDERTGAYVSKNEAKQLINSINGIGVYRNGFRIRPLGDPEYDWLMLNKKRIQNPSKKIGGDQVSGFVHIESEELSNLEEKSARDGLKENEAFEALRDITNRVIELIEEKRYILRRKLGISQPKQMLEKQFDSLYDYSKLKKSINKALRGAGINEESLSLIEKLIDEEETKNNTTVEEIRKTVAIYQGQATIGKIINVLLHEGRRPLNYFKGQVPNLEYYEKKFVNSKDEAAASKIVEISEGIETNARIFVNLFSRIDPLASKRRQNRKVFKIKNVLNEVLAVFENVLNAESIQVVLNCEENMEFLGFAQDFYAIFTNLVDNSIFWMQEFDASERKIVIDVGTVGQSLHISYRDSGPGISKELLDSGVIFEPDFSTKPDGGSGLGLAIAGEAAERNGLSLSAEEAEQGVHFILTERED